MWACVVLLLSVYNAAYSEHNIDSYFDVLYCNCERIICILQPLASLTANQTENAGN